MRVSRRADPTGKRGCADHMRLAGKKMRENCVALFVRISYHRIMTFRNSAKRDGYMKPCSQRELALSTRTVVA